MKILVYHGKHGDEYWVVNTVEKQREAMQDLFSRLDEMGCYEEDTKTAALDLARQGDPSFIREFLEAHRGCEYEDWDFEEAYE